MVPQWPVYSSCRTWASCHWRAERDLRKRKLSSHKKSLTLHVQSCGWFLFLSNLWWLGDKVDYLNRTSCCTAPARGWLSWLNWPVCVYMCVCVWERKRASSEVFTHHSGVNSWSPSRRHQTSSGSGALHLPRGRSPPPSCHSQTAQQQQQQHHLQAVHKLTTTAKTKTKR